MKKIENWLAIVLIILGLSCLAIAGTFLFEKSITAYFSVFIKTCVWMCLPILVIGIFYIIIFFKKK